MPVDETTVVAVFDNRMQAELTVNLLETFGVRAAILADDSGGAYPSMSLVHGVRVVVTTKDAEKAKQILARNP